MLFTVIGDIHGQEDKLFAMLRMAGIADEHGRPTHTFRTDPEHTLVLLGDIVHLKSRTRYAQLINVAQYDEHNPRHLRRAEEQQELFLRKVKGFQDRLPAGKMITLLGNHDYNAISAEQGPLRTGELLHLEWKDPNSAPLSPDLHEWIASWPQQYTYRGLHLAHVGPLPEHNEYNQAFYVNNVRQWIREDVDYVGQMGHQFGVYGHTPVRGGVNMASRGKALLLDTNGYGDEYAYAQIRVTNDGFRVRLHGLVFDELIRP